ncbi:hypothetical protein P4H94_06820 [Paenibacillus macerans]|uniref:hypothetical protein n=1 Tax=Paenibacillus TaxID=44249 RepID=UPI0018C2D3CE|nr:hypothetical protein [Paenibacillus macerans]MBS5913769.1 hypothetical protein [Paenibacillus macerans]MDU5950340.1 hypothetical protein [Paenibacillus macerans]MEC0136595.1 hypothetical protein [Paenibacillus macerans]UMV49009.1 hypothetical protein LMZ02_06480 [Paenibacillus macerans]GIP12797.1 hypothetical protein J1TS5_49670 [Paenibacillus macerans]
MKSILEELFDGNKNPAELIIPRNPQADSMFAEASFVYGFILALWIMIEVTTGETELVR